MLLPLRVLINIHKEELAGNALTSQSSYTYTSPTK